MNFRYLILLVIGIFLLAACSQVSQVSEEAAAVEATEELNEVETDQSADSQEEGEGQSSSQDGESEGLEALSSDDPEASLVSSEGCREKEPIALAYDVLSPPSELDWISGPDDALISVIEYGDFQ